MMQTKKRVIVPLKTSQNNGRWSSCQVGLGSWELSWKATNKQDLHDRKSSKGGKVSAVFACCTVTANRSCIESRLINKSSQTKRKIVVFKDSENLCQVSNQPHIIRFKRIITLCFQSYGRLIIIATSWIYWGSVWLSESWSHRTVSVRFSHWLLLFQTEEW